MLRLVDADSVSTLLRLAAAVVLHDTNTCSKASIQPNPRVSSERLLVRRGMSSNRLHDERGCIFPVDYCNVWDAPVSTTSLLYFPDEVLRYSSKVVNSDNRIDPAGGNRSAEHPRSCATSKAWVHGRGSYLFPTCSCRLSTFDHCMVKMTGAGAGRERCASLPKLQLSR